jgi:VanZ family protein
MPTACRPSPTAAQLWWPVLAYMALIFALSSISHPPALPGGDKNLHALLYSGLGLLVARARTGGAQRTVTLSIVAQAALFGAAYGASDELHQYFNPPRAVEALDVVADTIGAGLGATALKAWGIIQGRDGV